MKYNQKNYSNFILKKIVKSFLTISLISSTLLYLSFISFSRNNYIQHLKLNSQSSANLLEDYIGRTYSFLDNMKKNDLVEQFAGSDNHNSSVNLSLINYLNSSSQPYGETVMLVPDKERVLGNSHIGVTLLDYYLETLGISVSEFENYTSKLQKGELHSPAILFSVNPPAKMVLLFYISQYENPLYIISTCDLSQIDTSDNFDGNICIIQNGNKLLASIGNIDNIEVKKTFSKKGFSKYTKETGSSTDIKYFNISCMYTVPDFEYLRQGSSLLLLLFFIIAAAVICIFYFSKRITSQIYDPVGNLFKSINDSKVLKSDITELSYIANQINSLNYKNETMYNLVSLHKKPLSDMFLIKLITGTLSHDDIKSGISEHNLTSFKMPIVAFVANITNYSTFSSVLDANGVNIVMQNITNLFNSQFGNSEFKIISIDSNRLIGILCAENAAVQKQRLISCISNIETFFEARLRLVAGNITSSWYDISSSYQRALSLSAELLFSNSSVLFSDDISLTEAKPGLYYPQESENSLFYSIVHANREKTQEIISEIIDTNYSDKFLSVSKHQQLVSLLISTLTKAFIYVGIKEDEVFPKDFNLYATLIHSDTPDLLKSNLCSIFEPIYNFIDNTNKKNDLKLIQILKDYISDNYSNPDISLTTLAEYINMSQSHTSRQFKQLIGENFKTYLTNYRILKAKEILDANPAIKIKILATMVGYTNAETLNSAFSKYAGCLPSEYRNH